MSEQQHLELILGKHVYFSNPVMEIFPRLRDHSAVARNPFFAEASFFFHIPVAPSDLGECSRLSGAT